MGLVRPFPLGMGGIQAVPSNMLPAFTTEISNAGYQFSPEAVYFGIGDEGIRRQGWKQRNTLGR
jgi:hypothetical protein